MPLSASPRTAPPGFRRSALAVWPNRKPPAQWTMKEFLDFIPGSAPVLMYQYFRISENAGSQGSRSHTMLGLRRGLADVFGGRF